MSDFILIDGDIVNFLPTFGQATVIPNPGNLKASGISSVQGKKVCIEGDEKEVKVPGCIYTTLTHVTPGTGTLKIESLAGDQITKKMKDSKKPVLLKGKQFNAVFEVQNPAKAPPNNAPDPTKKYKGKGIFMTSNLKWKAT